MLRLRCRWFGGWALAIGFCAGLSAAQSRHATDLQGHTVSRLADKGSRVVVLIFAATDCPISNRYIPEIEAMHRDFAARHVTFWWVFPNPGDSPAAVRKHSEEFQIVTPTLTDPTQQLVRLAHVAVTPEAAVFAVKDGRLQEVYHGRIDDRYIAFGAERPQATHRELREAIEAALAGRPAPETSANPVGCSIIPAESKP